jgi:hypothetical protein
MTTPPDQHRPQGPWSENDLLDAIESARPQPGSFGPIEARLAAMRGDRDALRALRPETAPAGLLESALADALGEIDGETLRGLSDGRPTSRRPPVSRVLPERFSILNWIARNPGRAAGAMAAALLLTAGSAAGWGVTRMLRSPAARAGPVASAPSVSRPAEPVDGLPPATGAPATPVPAQAPALAAGPGPGSSEAAAPTLSEAVDLLGEGRLLLVARGGSAAQVSAALGRIAARGLDEERSFTVTAGLSPGAVALLDLPAIEQPAFASEDGAAPRVALPERTVWSASVRESPPALAALLNALRDAGLETELRALPRPVDLEPALDASQVLWWSRPPSAWRRVSAAPLVVETLPRGAEP